MSAVEELIPLSLMFSGQTACIRQVIGRADDVHRLGELGLRAGIEIEMLQPGKPCILRVGSHKLCFRADEMTSILVSPIDT